MKALYWLSNKLFAGLDPQARRYLIIATCLAIVLVAGSDLMDAVLGS